MALACPPSAWPGGGVWGAALHRELERHGRGHQEVREPAPPIFYAADASRYVTLGEIATKIRKGAEVRVVDAKTGADLTQPTLAQVIL